LRYASGDRSQDPNTIKEVPMSPKAATRKSTKSTSNKTSTGLTAEEKAAMRERVREARASKTNANGEKDVLAKIAEMQFSDHKLAKRLHEIITETAPDLTPKTWYGMPAYAKDDKVLCHFRPAEKFKTRYATLGFSDKANLDQGDFWPVEFALEQLTTEVEAKIVGLIKQAVAEG
jgi:uncharacterized protein YdhG (YjbR/CyaY superfamily)